MMRATCALAFALAACGPALLATPATAATIEIDASGPVVELVVTQSVEAEPDIAGIGAGVTTEAMSATEAMRANALAMRTVIERMRQLGIAERDIQTSGISLSPRYDYDEASRRQVFRGYMASNRVQVTLREIERIGTVLDALVEAGATDLSGPSWSIDDPAPIRARAREQAMRTARERALEYARHTGYSDARLLQVSEATAFNRPVMVTGSRLMDAAEASTPVQPGQVETGVTITVTYELTS